MKKLRVTSGLLPTLILVACGGGGGSAPPPPPPLAAPQISYPQTSYSFTTEVAIQALVPSVTGGSPTQWSVSPALPAGLTLVNTGQITGTPTQAATSANFVVTASNSAGNATFTLSLAVNSGTLLELGHVEEIVALRYEAARIVSRDRRGTWGLWNSSTGERLAAGSAACPTDCTLSIALGGNTFVISSDTNLNVRSATDGAQLWTTALPPGTWWAMAADGSYVATGDTANLTVRSRAGAQLFVVPGNFAVARTFATASELRIANGPAGSSVIQTYALPGGSTTVSPGFQGTFHSWFVDGNRFLTNLGNAVWVYSANATQQGAGTLPDGNSLAGSGDKVWLRVPNADPTQNSELRFYSFGPALTQVASFTLPRFANDLVRSGNTIGVLVEGGAAHAIIDLVPATPTWNDVTSPVSHLTAYAAISATDPVFGNQDGVLLRDEAGATPPQLLTRGRARSIAGSTTRFAISFSTGDIHYYDADTSALQGTLATPPPGGSGFFRPTAARLQLSRDGNTLAVSSVSEDGDSSYVTIYSLPSETVLNEYTFNEPDQLLNYSMSGSGDMFSFVSGAPGGATRVARVMRADNSLVWTDAQHAGSDPLLSHSGANAAFALAPLTPTSGSRVVENGTLAGTLNGAFIGWLDEQRVIANRFSTDSFGFLVYDGARILDRQGLVLMSPALPRLDGFQVVATDRIYAPQVNRIFDATNGNTVWDSANSDPLPSPGGLGAVAGGYVVFGSYSRIRVEPYQ